ESTICSEIKSLNFFIYLFELEEVSNVEFLKILNSNFLTITIFFSAYFVW
ncbi:unnamed protein product, partial [Larinioides sclopetarius]